MKNAMESLFKILRKNQLILSETYMRKYRKYFDFEKLYENPAEITLEAPAVFEPFELDRELPQDSL